jgi:hypothetical protein
MATASSSPTTTHSSGVSSTSSGSTDIRITSIRMSSTLNCSSSSSQSSSTSSVFGVHQWSRQSSIDEGVFQSSCNSPGRSLPSSPVGPKFKLIHEGDMHLCRLNHQRTVISKILSSKFLRRWENHRLYLTSVNIASKTVSIQSYLYQISKYYIKLCDFYLLMTFNLMF